METKKQDKNLEIEKNLDEEKDQPLDGKSLHDLYRHTAKLIK